MTRWASAALLSLALAGCGRPPEVRSAASAALPIAANLRASAEALQSRIAAQRASFEARNAELAQEAGLARDQAFQIEQDWKFQGEAALPKKLALFRENDTQILADPLAPVAIQAATPPSKAPAHDMSAVGKLIGGLDELRAQRRPDPDELFGFFVSANAKLREIQEEKAKSPAGDAPK